MQGLNDDLTIDVDRDAILAPAGTISVETAGSILLGTAGAAFSNDVRAAGTIHLVASATLIVEGSTRVASDDFGTNSNGLLSARAFQLVEVDGTAMLGAGGTAGADAAVLTGGNGDLNLIGTNPAALFSSSGDVIITTWVLNIEPASGITAEQVRIGTFIFGTFIVLGPATDASGLGPEISDAEIDRIFTPILRLNPDGRIDVTAPITFTTGTELILQPSSGPFAGSGTGSLSAQTLTFIAPQSSARTWTITANSVLLQPDGTPVPYVGVTTLNAIGSVQSDVFNVAPHPTTVIHIDGNLPAPPASPGDTLDFDLTGVVNPEPVATATPDGFQGTLTSSSHAPIEFEHIETIVGAPVDLQITKTDNASTAIAGTAITYTITVSNASGIEVSPANVTDTFPAAVTGVTWTCVPSFGSSCASAGNGNINENVTIGPNSFLTFTATGTIDPSATGTLTNTATVTAPTDLIETDPSNNTATDSTTIIGAASPAGIPALSPPMLALLAAALAAGALLVIKRM